MRKEGWLSICQLTSHFSDCITQVLLTITIFVPHCMIPLNSVHPPWCSPCRVWGRLCLEQLTVTKTSLSCKHWTNWIWITKSCTNQDIKVHVKEKNIYSETNRLFKYHYHTQYIVLPLPKHCSTISLFKFCVLKSLYRIYWEIIFIHWTFNFVFFMGRAIHEFKIPTKYLFTSFLLHIIRNPRTQVSTNLSIAVTPPNFVPIKLNDFTVID